MNIICHLYVIWFVKIKIITVINIMYLVDIIFNYFNFFMLSILDEIFSRDIHSIYYIIGFRREIFRVTGILVSVFRLNSFYVFVVNFFYRLSKIFNTGLWLFILLLFFLCRKLNFTTIDDIITNFFFFLLLE